MKREGQLSKTKTIFGSGNDDTPKMKSQARKSKDSKALLSAIDKQLSKPKRKSQAEIRRSVLDRCGC